MKRITFAFLIMLVGIALTWTFLRPNEWRLQQVSSEAPVAKVLSVTNDVRRQLKGRQLWEAVAPGEALYVGDRLRTANSSHITFLFTQRRSSVSVEENSLVLVDEQREQLQLKMLEGRLFVRQAPDAAAIDVQAGDKIYKIKGDAGIITNKAGEVQELAVASGEVFAIDKSGKSIDVLSTAIRGMKPSYGDTVYVDDVSAVTWSSIDDFDVLEMGESLDRLEKIPILQKLAGRIQFKTRPGSYYWRLSSKEGKKPVIRSTWIRRLPPILVSPVEQEVISYPKAGESVELRWMGESPDNAWRVQLFGDVQLSRALLDEEVKGKTFTTVKNLSEGVYYWKVSWLSAGDFSSRSQAFSVSPKGELPKPQLVYPIGQMSLVSGTEGMDVNLQWQPMAQAQTYLITLQKEGAPEEKTQKLTSSYLAKQLTFGSYSWSVLAKGAQGETSQLSRGQFKIIPRRTLEWIKIPKEVFFIDRTVSIDLQWQGNAQSRFQLSVSLKGENHSPNLISVQGPFHSLVIREAKDLVVSVRELDAAGNVVAQTEPTIVMVKLIAAPPAPQVDQHELQASGEGDVSVKVLNHGPGLVLWGELTDLTGRLVDQKQVPASELKLTELKPGSYWVTLYHEDSYRRRSEPSKKIKITVPSKSTIAPPKIKGIRIQ